MAATEFGQDRAALARLVSRLLVAHAADQGIDLFATDNLGGQGPATVGA